MELRATDRGLLWRLSSPELTYYGLVTAFGHLIFRNVFRIQLLRYCLYLLAGFPSMGGGTLVMCCIVR
ncbi:hypothetical protein VN97_g9002 [Penicillium thymicola]|uniref:Uncharacterized protein n=1 Tax=Penicillium thymicola TaxID=293382 RepID=A0AAI9TBR1_PENTH|nr:hypothetical protein VN97_g9002 [Penicillium thymicola]